MASKWKQRTLEEALAGVPARPIFVNKSREQVINPATGRLCAPTWHDKTNRPPSKRKGTSWFSRIKPDHPEYCPELAKKHFLMIQANGRKGTRASTPPGFRRADWKRIFDYRLNEARQVAERIAERAVVAFPEDVDENKAAKEALAFNIAIFKSDEISLAARMTAAAKVLEFTKQKPVSRTDNKISVAEDFLASLED